MTMLSALFQTGETMQLALDCTEGDVGDITSLVSKVKLAAQGLAVPGEDVPVAFEFTVIERAAVGPIPAGFDLIYTGEDIPAGVYCVNIKAVVDGYTFKSRHLFFKIEESAT